MKKLIVELSCCMRQSAVRSLWLIFILSSLEAHSAEWFSEETGISFQMPTNGGWGQRPCSRAEAKLVIQSPDASINICVIAFTNRTDEPITEEAVKEWESDYFKKGNSVKTSGEFFVFHGRRAYKVSDIRPKQDWAFHETVILWNENYHTMEIVVSKVDAEPLEDEVVKAFVASKRSRAELVVPSSIIGADTNVSVKVQVSKP